MKKLFKCALILILSVAAVGTVMADEIKIGYVDLQEALNNSDAGKKAREVFKGEVERLQRELDRQQAELKKLKDELEKRGLLLSEETRVRKEKEYQDRLKQFQRFYEDSQDQLQQKDAQLTRKILIELRKVIASLGREDGYTIILEKGESNILYATDSIDLTAEVVRRYNESRKQP